MKELALNELDNFETEKFKGTEIIYQNRGCFCYCEHTYYVLWIAVDTETSVPFGNC
jgi:hypothetical protein